DALPICNVLDPLDIIDGITLEDLVAKRTSGLMQPRLAEKIEKATRKEFPDGIIAHGADALRFTIAALAGHGRDIKFDLGRAEGYKNFCNKLWNASRFVLGSLPEVPTAEQALERGDGIGPAPVICRPAQWPATDTEKWILSRLATTVSESQKQFRDYRFDLLSQTLYDFTWNQFCDWFLELSKPFVNAKVAVDIAGDGDLETDIEATASVQYTLAYVLETLLRLLHPLVPFVTEELWRQVAPRLGIEGGSISLQAYPLPADFAGQDYAAAAADIEWLKAMVSALRRVRSELGVSP